MNEHNPTPVLPDDVDDQKLVANVHPADGAIRSRPAATISWAAGLIMERSLNGVGETAAGDLGTYRVADFLIASQLLGVSAYVELDLISFVVFNGVGITLDVLDRSADRLPCRTRLMVRQARCGRGGRFPC